MEEDTKIDLEVSSTGPFLSKQRTDIRTRLKICWLSLFRRSLMSNSNVSLCKLLHMYLPGVKCPYLSASTAYHGEAVAEGAIGSRPEKMDKPLDNDDLFG